MQLSENIDRAARAGASRSMIERAVARSFESLQGVQFDQHIDRRRQTRALIALAITLIVPLLVTIAAPSTVGLWARCWFLGST